jgi:hypothetical protein
VFSCYDPNSDQTSETKLYVCLQAQNQVAVYDVPSLELKKLIDIDYSHKNTPHFIVIDEENDFWFVTAMEGGYIAQYNLVNDEFIDTISVGNNPALMTIDPVNKTLFCSRMSMADMPSMGGMGHMGMIVETNIITEIMYTKDGLSLGREFILDSDILHGITYDYNKENIITASITDDWLYKIPLNDDPLISNTMDSLITTYVENYPNRLQPLQIISLNDSLVAISCSGFMNNVNGQVQIWNIQKMQAVISYEFDDKSIPWHLIKAPLRKEIFIVLGGSNGEGGVACLTYTANEIELKWQYMSGDFTGLHGITIDAAGEYLYVSGRDTHYLYQFDAVHGSLIASIPLAAENQIVSPGGISMMQNVCTDCE